MGTVAARERGLAGALAVAICIACTFVPSLANAQANAEAAALFTSANEHLRAGEHARGERRTRELEAAIADYAASLRIVRSRNVLFNASLALELLGRDAEAYDHLAEYLAVPGLTAEEQTEAQRRIDAIAPRVAVLVVESEPAGAEVWVDRRDLAPRGRTPLRVAVAAGPHRLWLRAAGHADVEATTDAAVGDQVRRSFTLVPSPVALQIVAPADAQLTLDGERVEAGAQLTVAPGTHVVRLEVDGAVVDRRVEVPIGAPPIVIDLAAAVPARRRATTLALRSDGPARVLVDGVLAGRGERMELPIEPGDHEITVEAEGRVPFRARRTFELGQRQQLQVSLVPEATGSSLDGPRIALGITTGVGLVTTGSLMIAALTARESYDDCVVGIDDCLGRANETTALNLAADVSLGITAALGVTTLVLLLVPGAQETRDSIGTFAIAPLPDGGMITASIPLERGAQ